MNNFGILLRSIHLYEALEFKIKEEFRNTLLCQRHTCIHAISINQEASSFRSWARIKLQRSRSPIFSQNIITAVRTTKTINDITKYCTEENEASVVG